MADEISEEEGCREKEVMEELFSRHTSMLHDMVGIVFTGPRKKHVAPSQSYYHVFELPI